MLESPPAGAFQCRDERVDALLRLHSRSKLSVLEIGNRETEDAEKIELTFWNLTIGIEKLL